MIDKNKKNELGYTLNDALRFMMNNEITISDISIFEENNEKNNKQIIELLREYLFLIKYLPDELRKSKAFTKIALQSNIYVIDYIYKKYYNDHEIMLDVVRNKGILLEYASDEIKDNKPIAWEAIKNNPYAIFYVSKRLRGDIDLAIEALKHDKQIFKNLNHVMRSNRKVVEYAMEKSISNVLYIHETLINDKEFMLKLIKKHMRTNIEMSSEENIMIHLGKRSELFMYPLLLLNNNIKNNDTYNDEYIEKSYKLDDDKEFMLEIIKIDICMLAYASYNLQKSRDFVIEVIRDKDRDKNNEDILKYMAYNNLREEYEEHGTIFTYEELHKRTMLHLCDEIDIIGTNMQNYPFKNYEDVIQECSICCNKIKFMDMCWISCKHYYHYNCLQKWLLKSATCPMCRMKVTHMNVDMIQGSHIDIYNEIETGSESEDSFWNNENYNSESDTTYNDLSNETASISNDEDDEETESELY